MKIAIIATGYVGLVTGVCLSDFGNNIICVDKDKEKIDILNKGKLPIYESRLKEIIERNRHYKRIEFTTDIKYTGKNSEVIFITVGTPEKEDIINDSAIISGLLKAMTLLAYPILL